MEVCIKRNWLGAVGTGVMDTRGFIILFLYFCISLKFPSQNVKTGKQDPGLLSVWAVLTCFNVLHPEPGTVSAPGGEVFQDN